ncbi:ferredoxin [Desulfogranum marinum]|uniref:ferredoxin n=1 Tax=Desulfogranum marinum TaxID=453220 RepID=UPI00196637CA|nr:ferredoxin [Desulfogranum marinum]MBM9514217.1 ferredoxin [Desulfogranum marinum]
MHEIIIDTYLCNACKTCIEMCPDVFELNELTGKAALIHSDQKVTDAIREAAAYCPEKCIEIQESIP